jgi:hypothetical protein
MFVIHLMMARGAETCREKNVSEEYCRNKKVATEGIDLFVIYCKVTQQDATYRNKNLIEK